MKSELILRLTRLLSHVSDEELGRNRVLAKFSERVRLALAYLEALSRPSLVPAHEI